MIPAFISLILESLRPVFVLSAISTKEAAKETLNNLNGTSFNTKLGLAFAPPVQHARESAKI